MLTGSKAQPGCQLNLRRAAGSSGSWTSGAESVAQTEAAEGEYLAQEAVQLAVIQSLVTGVASSYFQLLELDQELQVAKQSLASRQGSLRLVQARLTGGISNQLEVDQAMSSGGFCGGNDCRCGAPARTSGKLPEYTARPKSRARGAHQGPG